METKLISRFQFSQLNVPTSSQNCDIYLNQPLTFSEYPGGIILELVFFGLLNSANTASYARILGKNSSNQTVVLSASGIENFYDPDLGRPASTSDDIYFQYLKYRFTINSDGTGIQARVVPIIGTGMTSKPFSKGNAAITQVIGLRLTISSTSYTRGGYLKAYGLKQ